MWAAGLGWKSRQESEKAIADYDDDEYADDGAVALPSPGEGIEPETNIAGTEAAGSNSPVFHDAEESAVLVTVTANQDENSVGHACEAKEPSSQFCDADNEPSSIGSAKAGDLVMMKNAGGTSASESCNTSEMGNLE